MSHSKKIEDRVAAAEVTAVRRGQQQSPAWGQGASVWVLGSSQVLQQGTPPPGREIEPGEDRGMERRTGGPVWLQPSQRPLEGLAAGDLSYP